MRVFIIALLVALSQAEMFQEEQQAFKKLAGISMDNIVVTIEQEMNKFIHRGLSPDEINIVRDLAEAFAHTVREELSKAVAKIEEAGTLSARFTERMINKLKLAAVQIAHGLDMTPEMFEQFVESILKDIAEFEVQGALNLDHTFHDILEKAIAMVHHKYSQRRDVADIWDKVQDTLKKIVGHLQGKYHDLGDFFRDTLKKTIENLQPHIANIKVLAKDFLDHISTVKESVLRQAIEFFRPFAEKLGDVWKQLLKKAHERLDEIAANQYA